MKQILVIGGGAEVETAVHRYAQTGTLAQTKVTKVTPKEAGELLNKYVIANRAVMAPAIPLLVKTGKEMRRDRRAAQRKNGKR